jgi:hypothetical protein
MKVFLIKSSFAQFIGTFILLASILTSGDIVANAQANNTVPSQSSAEISQTKNGEKPQAVTEVHQSENRPTVILAADVSISVKSSAEKMRAVLQQIANVVPENSVIGVVSIGTQSEKRVFSNREEALAYLSKITPNSSYTDLERGTDAVLAVMQEAKATKPILVIYLTDGEVSLPKELKNRVDFKTVLTREFLVRPEVRVLILNVAAKPMDATGLPPNVAVVPLSNWEEAEKQMRQTLAVQIQEELKTEPAAVQTTAEKETMPPETKGSRLATAMWVIVTTLAVAGVGGLAWFWFRRRKWNAEIVEEVEESEPENLLRPEELLLQSNERPSGLAAVVDFFDGKVSRSEVMVAEDRRVVGKSAVADVRFDSLKQDNSIELRFDGKQVSAFRLHPQIYYEVDEVWLNQTKTPLSQTSFHLQNADLLKVGNIQITVKIVESSVARIIVEKNSRSAAQSFRAASENQKPKPATATTSRQSNARQSRWN